MESTLLREMDKERWLETKVKMMTLAGVRVDAVENIIWEKHIWHFLRTRLQYRRSSIVIFTYQILGMGKQKDNILNNQEFHDIVNSIGLIDLMQDEIIKMDEKYLRDS